MTLRTVVLPLGFGLSAVLCSSARGAPDAEGRKRPPVRVYTNEDLDRVRPFRDETGVRSVPAVPVEEREAARRPGDERAKGRGEAYWRREAERVRDRVRAMEAQAAELRAQIAERAAEASRLSRGRSASPGSGSPATLRAKLEALERRMREIEDGLADRARREGALPGWLR
jgi:hypothetical protein